mmetsp:Transcript_15108/g.43658  ORF Transcript_15108/g.43658 Transcript_15108/m.43658 type:complete len:587 (+) Transcript_15108:46-1806(+)
MMLTRVAIATLVVGGACADSAEPKRSRFLQSTAEDASIANTAATEATEATEAKVDAPRSAKVAVAFAGGGFRAFAIDVGLAAGLLAVKARHMNGTEPTFAETNFLERFDTISSNSGSTWFWAELAFSQRFRDMIEQMAAAPHSGSSAFSVSWMRDWIGVGEGVKQGEKMLEPDDIERAFKDAGGADGDRFNIRQAMHELTYFWKRGLSWFDFVALLLKTTGALQSDNLLGDPVPEWLEGKVWLSVHSAATGTASKLVRMSQSNGQTVQYYDSLSETYGDAVPVYLPAKHSIVFGAGRSAEAPYPYFAPTSGLSLGRSIKYRGTGFLGTQRLSEESAPLDRLGRATEMRSGEIPVAGVAAASSAVAGGVCLSSSLSTIEGMLNPMLTPWAALSVGGEATFSQGAACFYDLEDKGMSRGRLRVCARTGVIGIIDGGYTEGSGVAQAVAVGADEVVVVVNDLISISGLYQRDKGSSEPLGIPMLHLPIFAERYHESMFVEKVELRIPRSARFLKRFMVATAFGTTIKNDLFGIAAGRNVTLRVVYMKAGLQIGVLSDYDGYTKFSQEVVETMLDEGNADVVDDWFLQFF